ncbi:MAG: D-hexose-6-phosphate mutarotase [Anaerolineales bacterium]|nr:D-hexose-6-phosphate mutarotase [Anaerolineales bacterium]
MDLRPGRNGLPCLTLMTRDGARADIYADGAHVTSWIPAGGSERLFLSEVSEFTPGRAIRGGVPLVFPQFSGEGALPKHGFARNQMWELDDVAVGADRAVARFSLEDNEATRAIWPSRFHATCTVVIGGDALSVTLGIRNTDVGPFTFAAALHTYLAVQDCRLVNVTGLTDLAYRDAALGDPPGTSPRLDTEPAVRFQAEVDRVYYGAGPVRVNEPGRTLAIAAEGLPDVVVWNPGPGLAAQLKDLPPNGHLSFICVEAAVIGRPVLLAPGQSWQGTQHLRTA